MNPARQTTCSPTSSHPIPHRLRRFPSPRVEQAARRPSAPYFFSPPYRRPRARILYQASQARREQFSRLRPVVRPSKHSTSPTSTRSWPVWDGAASRTSPATARRTVAIPRAADYCFRKRTLAENPSSIF